MKREEEPILQLEGLSFGFETAKPILKEISFAIERGSLSLITGPNGSGKSLLLKCIKGLLKPTAGTILLEGEDLTHHGKARLRSIGLVFQDSETQIVGQTVERDILFGLENLQLPLPVQRQRLDDVVALLDLTKQLKQRPRALSGGEKRRLSIAGVLVMEPKLLIMDEPFANLDYPSVVQVLKTLLRLRNEGHTIILVSHEVEKILAYIDKVIILEGGTVAAQGPPSLLRPLFKEHGVYVPEECALEDLTWLKP
ncbi:ABC transporter ATP-binding protein [Sphaerochaeta sp. PS]|uniref:energy-coupling factor ABC transporter ATP-binding protein n=1 Tax=Sphaerochaeta sp. PS TaxID=3076336 RepID=UPI0028A3E01F|nr:ABC transporter ATP-binding protein [Sphaerochaeta sp. PS]MDT4761343.1 ABC transporter ATP-binding protein [Sphaerochaeta sp. PS]